MASEVSQPPGDEVQTKFRFDPFGDDLEISAKVKTLRVDDAQARNYESLQTSDGSRGDGGYAVHDLRNAFNRKPTTLSTSPNQRLDDLLGGLPKSPSRPPLASAASLPSGLPASLDRTSSDSTTSSALSLVELGNALPPYENLAGRTARLSDGPVELQDDCFDSLEPGDEPLRRGSLAAIPDQLCCETSEAMFPPSFGRRTSQLEGGRLSHTTGTSQTPASSSAQQRGPSHRLSWSNSSNLSVSTQTSSLSSSAHSLSGSASLHSSSKQPSMLSLSSAARSQLSGTESDISRSSSPITPVAGFRIPATGSAQLSTFPLLEMCGPAFADLDGNPVYVCSAILGNTVQPGKAGPHLSPPVRLSYGGLEIPHDGRFDLLPITPEMRWITASHGRIPEGYEAVQGGYEEAGQQLFHALAKIQGFWVPGKTAEHLYGACFPFAGQEVRMTEGYRTLCWVGRTNEVPLMPQRQQHGSLQSATYP